METHRIFLPDGHQKLDVSYIPPQLPHREEHIKLILEALGPLMEAPAETFFPPLLHGPTGTGKTSSMKKAAKKIREGVKKRIILHYVHVPCSVFTKSYSVVQKISEGITSAPPRGLGGEELLSRVYGELETRDEYLLLVLDDVDELIKRDRGRLLFMITRLEEGGGFRERRVFPTLIMRKWRILRAIPPAVRSKITGLRVEFQPYNAVEMASIVRQRVKLAFQPGVITPNTIKQISFNGAALGGGDARYALALLNGSAHVALRMGTNKIEVEHARRAQQEFDKKPSSGVVERADRFGLAALMAAAKCFRDNPDKYTVSIGEIYGVFQEVARKINVEARPRRELAQKLYDMCDAGILHRVEGKIVLSNPSAETLYDRVLKLIYE
ncbi:MAG: Cdc6/Cdc18 family protein [Candidatus Geothermarchaeales archaeon]